MRGARPCSLWLLCLSAWIFLTDARSGISRKDAEGSSVHSVAGDAIWPEQGSWAGPAPLQGELQLGGRSAGLRELQQATGAAVQPGKSGSVLTWGDLSKVGPTPPEVMNGNVIKIAAANYFGMALLDTREVVTWNINKGSRFDPPAGIQGATADIAAGTSHAVALLLNGTVVAWGNKNDVGQLDVPSVLTPDNGAVKAVSIAAGFRYSLALLSNGSVLAWGKNSSGQCAVPSALANVTSVAAGDVSSLAVLAKGKLVEWGTKTNPVVREGIASVAIGEDQVLAVLRNGSVISWPAGAPGYPDILQQVITVPAAARSNATAVSAKENVSMALLDTGEVVAWGWTPPDSQPLSPVPEAAKSKAMAIAAGFGYAMALIEGTFPAPAPPPPPPPHPTYPPAPPPFQPAQQGMAGSVTVWGDISSIGAQPLGTLEGVVKIAAGTTVAIALLNTGEVIAWSATNDYGQSNVPPSIQGHVVDISAGAYHALALVNSSVVAWGDSESNKTKVPPELQPGGSAEVIRVSAGYDHSLAQLKNGSVVAWGSNTWGQAIVPAAARTNVVAITAGDQNSLAVLSDGSLVEWGVTSRQAVVDNVGVVSVAAGTDQLVALLRNGTVVSWYASGDLLTPAYPGILSQVLSVPDAATSNVVAVSANENVSMALLDTGRVVAWGWTPVDVAITKVPQAAQSNVVAIAAGGGYAMALTLTATTTLPVTPSDNSTGSVTGTNTLPNTSADSSTGSKLGTGPVVGIVIGAVALLAGIGTGILLLVRRKPQQPHEDQPHTLTVYKSGPSSQALKGTAVWDHLVQVLRSKEAFMRSVAQEYSWIISSSLTGAIRSVEAGVNDTQLDKLYQRGQAMSPVVELSRSELRDQVHLLADGLLGRGATALVFKCVWPSRFGSDSLLAIKVLKDGSDADVSAVQSFAYEAKLLASLRHPNVVRVYGYCLEPPTMCLILELLPTSLKQKLYGTPTAVRPCPTCRVVSHTDASDSVSNPGSSSQFTTPSKPYPGYGSSKQTPCKADNQLNSPQSSTAYTTPTTTLTSPVTEGHVVVEVMPDAPQSNAVPAMTLLEIVRTSTDIAAGLAYLHSQEEPVIPELGEVGLVMQSSAASPKDKRIVHRDLKPANILLNSEGAAKITDFGLARDHDHTTVGAVNMGVGTMPYMAPEQLTAARAGRAGVTSTNRVDVYSLGMMMWEMLAGEVPWKGKSEDMIFAVVMNHRRPALPGVQPAPDGDDVVSEQESMQRHVPGLYDHPLLPELNHIIQQCWQQRDRKRPTAAAVHDLLQDLLHKMEAEHAM